MATAVVTLQEDAYVLVSSSAAFTAQNQTGQPILFHAAASLPAASAKGIRVANGETFGNSLTDRNWYATIDANGTDTGDLIVEET